MGEITKLITMEELIQKEQHRADCFRLLAASLYEPNKKLMQEEGFFNSLKTSLRVVYPDALTYAEQMERSFNFYSEQELLIDYAALFLGPLELKAPPYGSVYLERDRRLMGDTTLAVMEYYSQSGLTTDEDFKEPADHITAEMEFIYYLIFIEVKSIQDGALDRAVTFVGRQKEFMKRFLTPWIEEFCEKIRDNAQTQYYSDLSECLLMVTKHTTIICDETLNNLMKKC